MEDTPRPPSMQTKSSLVTRHNNYMPVITTSIGVHQGYRSIVSIVPLRDGRVATPTVAKSNATADVSSTGWKILRRTDT